MKVLFAGPSIVGLKVPAGIILRGPAMQGDIIRATLDGATAIGLVDGLFDDVASVWHKDILFALSEGVRVCGAASMGALRAAECAEFGMVGIGAIYRRYASGELDDDAAVAQLHAPAELGYSSITEPLVNVEATIEALRKRRRISAAETGELLRVAGELHFKERTYGKVVDRLKGVGGKRRVQLASLLHRGNVDLKRRDAEELIRYLESLPEARDAEPEWEFSITQVFQLTLNMALTTRATN